MAYLDDDFQGYSIGANVPFGSWILDPGAFLAQIVAGGSGIPTTDRSLAVQLGRIAYVHGSYLSSFTEFCDLLLGANLNSSQVPFEFSNGPNGGGITSTLLQIRIETDGTISAVCPQSGELLANSNDAVLRFYTFNFFQINVTLSDVAVAGVNHVNIAGEVAIDGVSVLTFNATTAVLSSGLTNGTAEVNRFQLSGGQYGAFTLDTLQAIVSYPHAGSPSLIAYQAPIEVDQLLDSGVLDVFQSVLEVDELPDSANVRVIQAVLEVDLKFAPGANRPEYIHRRHFPGD